MTCGDPVLPIDQMWLYMAPDLYATLVDGRGWAPERVEAWLAARIRGPLRRPATGSAGPLGSAARISRDPPATR